LNDIQNNWKCVNIRAPDTDMNCKHDSKCSPRVYALSAVFYHIVFTNKTVIMLEINLNTGLGH